MYWREGAHRREPKTALARALMASTCLPELVHSVDVWERAAPPSVLVAVTFLAPRKAAQKRTPSSLSSSSSYSAPPPLLLESLVRQGATRTKARQAAAIAANDLIASLLDRDHHDHPVTRFEYSQTARPS